MNTSTPSVFQKTLIRFRLARDSHYANRLELALAIIGFALALLLFSVTTRTYAQNIVPYQQLPAQVKEQFPTSARRLLETQILVKHLSSPQ